jgi:hypothetical protein
MIMPANPAVGVVFRPENLPGLVFEEVTITATGVTVLGPRGPVSGAIETSELQADGGHETKYFAPGYGEFSALGGAEFVTAALGLPIDAIAAKLPVALPAELSMLAEVAAGIVADPPGDDWDTFGANTDLLETIWAVYRTGDVPPVLAIQMDDAVAELLAAAEDEDPVAAQQAALNVSRAALDLQLPYIGPVQADLDAVLLWTVQLANDAAADDGDGVSGGVAALEAVWDRIDTALPADVAEQGDALLTDLRIAADDENLAEAAGLATEFDALLARYSSRP